MTKKNLFMNIIFLLIAIVLCAISGCYGRISDKRLCYDPECSELISLAKTSLKYITNDPDLLSFDVNVNAEVYSKEAGSRRDLWGVEINGKRGYAPKRFLKEFKVFQKILKHEVPTDLHHNDNSKHNVDQFETNEEREKSDAPSVTTRGNDEINKDDKANLNGASPPYEVIDGTTITLEYNKPTVQPNSVKEIVQATAVPNKQQNDIPIADVTHTENNETIFNNNDESPSANIEKNVKENGHDFSEDTETKPSLDSSKEEIEISDIAGIATAIPNIGGNITKTKSIGETDVKDVIKEQDVSTHHEESNDNVHEHDNSIESSNVNKTELTHEDGIYQSDDTQSILEKKSDTDEVSSNEASENIAVLKLDSEKDNIETKETVLNTSRDSVIENHANEVKPDQQLSDVTDNQDALTENDQYAKQDDVQLKSESIHNEPKQVQDAESVQPSEQLNTFTDSPLSKEDVTDQPNQITDPYKNQSSSEESILEETLKSIPSELSTNVNKEDHTNSIVEQENFQVLNEESSLLTPEIVSVNTESIQESPKDLEAVELNTTESIPTNTSAEIVEEKTESVLPHEPIITEESKEETPALSHEISITEDANTTIFISEIASGIPANTDSHVTDENVNEAPESSEINTVPDFISHAESIKTPPEEKASESNNEASNLEHSENPLYPSQENVISEHSIGFNEFRNRNLLNAEEPERNDKENVIKDNSDHLLGKTLPETGDGTNTIDDTVPTDDTTLSAIALETQGSPADVCVAEDDCTNIHDDVPQSVGDDNVFETEENAIMSRRSMEENHWLRFMYVTTTAVTVLLFCLGYYYIENMRRDGQLIAKINKLEKDLLVATKECTVLSDNLTITKEKLSCIEDESFGSNEMVLSLKADLEASQNVKVELEDQIATLEKDLESATEVGLELERMLREVLSSNNAVNPIAESVEGLQGRLNAQQAENESLIEALNIKSRENETLAQTLADTKNSLEQVEIESVEMTTSLKQELEKKNSSERALNDKVQRLEMQLKEISTQKATLEKELKNREVELKDLSDVVTQLNCNNLDLEKLYDVSRIKAEATQLLEEKNELKIRLSEVEGAHNLLEEHVKLVKEEIVSLSEQCKIAEKERKDAETRLEVLTNFFNEKEAQRQKEEAIWLQKQGEVVSTVERIQSMQNEMQNYKQQMEMLKREILDQEREYKSQISLIETKAHEQWVVARQAERRLEESKAEAGQLRNRLTLIEKNISDADPETKLHRLEANGETAPPLFIGADSSSSPIMFSGPSGVLPPPPPPSYMHHSIFPPYMPPPIPSGGIPPFEVGQRPPPLGGRLSSPPPMPLHGSASGRYENAASPPPMSPHLLPPYNHRSPPPPFGNDRLHPPPPPPPGSILPPPLGSTHSWGEETLPPLRNSSFHPHHREQRVRNHKGSLHSSGESLDKSHHNSKV